MENNVDINTIPPAFDHKEEGSSSIGENESDEASRKEDFLDERQKAEVDTDESFPDHRDVISYAIRQIRGIANSNGLMHSLDLDASVINKLREQIPLAKDIQQAIEWAHEIIEMIEVQVASIQDQLLFLAPNHAKFSGNRQELVLTNSDRENSSFVVFDSELYVTDRLDENSLTRLNETAEHVRDYVTGLVKSQFPDYIAEQPSEQ